MKRLSVSWVECMATISGIGETWTETTTGGRRRKEKDQDTVGHDQVTVAQGKKRSKI